MKLDWHPDAWDEYVGRQSGDRKTLKRINAFIKDIQRGEDGGIGKPELLKGDLSGWASRRITEEHRLVYRVLDARDQLGRQAEPTFDSTILGPPEAVEWFLKLM
ncbi:Txe/YoeB family addiction module toxin [Actinoplanes rectilineatus]|uniref:Txe/YoeB family addiction module toxin n=1 Tax=Actinoplanes rectilineatus TaxID=113571 RepID=UPI0005F296C5|nr:Txe/YoeB family addiction module toxin [Actinoplanes rectilineatus]